MKLSDYVTSFTEKMTDSIFLVSGGGIMHLVDSIGRSNLDSYCCHHEQACALAAEGYARMKNDIGVICVTTGPGGTNAITGVAASWMDGIPMMVISGQVRREIMLKEKDKKRGLRQIGPQELNIVDVVKPITKYAATVMNPNEIKYHLEKASYIAKEGKPGPVWIDIPLDVQSSEIDEETLKNFSVPKKQKLHIPLEKIVNELEKSKKPLMLVGHGVRLAGAYDLLWEFIEKSKINVVSAMSGDDLVNEDYPYYLGKQGMTGTKAANYAVDNCDLLLVLGTRMQMRQTSFDYDKFAKKAKKIMVDIDKAELDKINFKPNIKVESDAKDFLENILEKEIRLNRWQVNTEPILYESKKNFIDIYEFFQEGLNGKCDFPIITSNGMTAEVTHQAARLKKGQRLITNTALGEMGKGLPMAIGACIANKKKPVICMEGDGSIMMNLQELETMKYHNLPLKVFIFNNGGYYSIRNTHRKFFNKIFAADEESGVSLPNWENLINGWGIKYEKIKNKNDLYKIKNILDYHGPVVCELMIDPEQKGLPKWSAK
ncbi:MAG: thiamine pyrophosphate-binding protein [Candidatus Nanoarchaeia archaeon]|nr:thiamine pyrophosphate-binding protein [Candidatus Nanoarchaeia archaeon]MDD5358104.1 thiamine pyrophosphate-binding protein [Candidatus Nanoarchaeia archaeon]MDD5589291.1 thiamine pyrophosphate-binding protein [Candidatus Nanoarchaeia archaeon]